MADLPISDEHNVVLYDDAGNQITVVSDGSDKRLAVDSKDSLSSLVESGKVYSVIIDALAIAGATQVPLLLLKNPNASGKFIKILGVEYSTDAATAIIRVYRDPTITTNGTSITPVNLLKSGGASVVTSFRGSTISVNGTQLGTLYTSKGDANITTIGSQFAIQANENLLITVQPQANKTHYVTLTYSEV